MFVVDTAAARAALHARMLACPQDGCVGRLGPWGHGRSRTVTTRPGQQVRLAPDRGRCGTCQVSQTLLPAWYVPRRCCGIEVIGAAIEGAVSLGHPGRRVAGMVGVPHATVRGWLRCLRGAAGNLRAAARQAGPAAGWVDFPAWPAAPMCVPATAELAGALDELTLAAAALTRPDPPPRPGAVTGIDYLHLLGAQARAAASRRLRLAGAPDGLGRWPAINVLTGGRLLTGCPARAPA